MESHLRSLNIDPSLMDVVRSWESKNNKVRRPPNAFMLFGKDNRKRLAQQNPHISNKVISEMLGKKWAEAPSHIKEEYYKNARIIGSLHAKMFPGYHYSPSEARRKKAEKLNRCKEAVRKVRGKSPEERTQKEAMHSLEYWPPSQDIRPDKNYQEGENLGLNVKVEGSEYVPNNEEHFNQLFDEETAPGSEDQPAILNANLNGRKSGPSRSDQHLYFSPSYTMGVPSSSAIPSKSPSPYCSGTNYCLSSTSSNSCENTTPSYYPYCSSRLLGTSVWCQRPDDNQQGFHTVPCCTSAQYRPSLRHQSDRSTQPYFRNSDLGFYRHVNTFSEVSESEFTPQNPQAGVYSENQRFLNSCKSSKDGLFLEPSYLKSGYLPNYIQLDPKEEMSDCFVQFSNSLKRIPYGCECTQTRRDYDDSEATRDAIHNSFENESDSFLEIDVENETSSSSDSESEIAEATNLVNNELSMPTQESLVSFGALVSSAIQNVGIENLVTPSSSSSAINNEITDIDSKPDNEPEIVVKEHGMPDILDTFK